MREELLIVGDFNIHVDSSNNESKGFLDILNANGLTQHVTCPTHQKGHTLDLVITREQSNLLSGSPIVFISGVSDANSSSSLDHYAVLCYLNVNRPKTVHKSVNFRAFIKIPVPAYQNDVKMVLNNQSKTPDNINDLNTWSIQQSTTTHTKHIHNTQQQNSNYTQTHCELFHQTIHKHATHKTN